MEWMGRVCCPGRYDMWNWIGTCLCTKSINYSLPFCYFVWTPQLFSTFHLYLPLGFLWFSCNFPFPSSNSFDQLINFFKLSYGLLSLALLKPYFTLGWQDEVQGRSSCSFLQRTHLCPAVLLCRTFSWLKMPVFSCWHYQAFSSRIPHVHPLTPTLLGPNPHCCVSNHLTKFD